MDKLNYIQQNLKAPKGQTNSFGKYKYRSCEDILEAVKPLLGTATLVISDEIVMLGDRFYVKATATLKDGKEEVSNTAYAREAQEKKGMDESQITGASSSYARKYALNGLFLIDDTKDADSMDNRSNVPSTAKTAPQVNSKPLSPTVKIAPGDEPVCMVCGEIALPSKFPKPGATHYCGNYRTCGKDTIVYPDKRDEVSKNIGAEMDKIPDVDLDQVELPTN